MSFAAGGDTAGSTRSLDGGGADAAGSPRSLDIVDSPGARAERDSFDRLFRECAADVHAYAISLLRDHAAAEDITALAFERLYRSRRRIDRGRGTPRALLFAIARNAALDELRRRSRHPQRELVEDHDRAVASDADDNALAGVERKLVLRDALRELSLREREIVLLKFHGQLTNGELARALGISESNAGTRLHRALERLRGRCGELERGGGD